MTFETLTLRPVDGHLDEAGICEWLNNAPYVFLDPVEGQIWHMEASPRCSVLARMERERDPKRFPFGVLLFLDDNALHITAQADLPTLKHLHSFLTWLLARGEWIAKRDWGEPYLLPHVDDLFRGVDLNVPDVVDDLTFPPVVNGALLRLAHKDTQLNVHSEGQLRLDDFEQTHHGVLEPDALAAWNAAVAKIDFHDPAMPDSPDEEDLWIVERETPTDEEGAVLEGSRPPPSFAPLMRLTLAWIEALRAGTPPSALRP